MKIKFFDKRLEDFIKSLEKPAAAKILRTLDLLEMFGYELGMPHSRKISNRLFELRIRGTQEIRIFYTFYKNEAILLHGFLKKTEQTPQKEISIASAKLQRLT
ncbi:hypothetical protein A2Z63_02185 [Candidatus Giovannonibacteria bacterium RIFCSPLOWO2_02_44_8]|uniref:Addiction module toxin RelE n=1 Tax=Candidatus Giovannonibacteria bacterium RIFCSPLOWO2_02_44_8 TaxID=1798355 RepID=A0A1F5XAA9_9BACT|nr:MAG: hypothetical protein A2Z63_02185 [Candidatus Giovannonibacteria bacterium RIFCSPLOWO2_02_44_8]